MGMQMIIRDETESDIDAIGKVTAAAFAAHPHSRQTEHFIVKALRAAGALTVSLVAAVDGKVVGHIAVSPVTISDGSERWYGLGPLSVWPACQRQEIGTALVREGLARLQALKAQGCVLVGDPAYYVRFGFSSPPGLRHAGVPQENLLARRWGGNEPRGEVVFHPGFGVTG